MQTRLKILKGEIKKIKKKPTKIANKISGLIYLATNSNGNSIRIHK